MTSTFKITVPEEFRLATRLNGEEAREAILRMLDQYDVVELDFAKSNLTPSFADECVGRLCQSIGWETFKKRILISNLSDASRSLLKVVLTRRRHEKQLSEV